VDDYESDERVAGFDLMGQALGTDEGVLHCPIEIAFWE
jgi:hypothetical protein